MPHKILIAEDDASIAQIVKLTLEIENHEVFIASDGRIASEAAETNQFDLAVLDIMLPKLDGYQLLELFKKKNIPVIFLSAKTDLADRVKGIRLGAEDYITKPFETVELLARVDNALRRLKKTSGKLYAGDVVLDLESHTATKGGKAAELTPLEYELLEKLMSNQGLLFTRDRLLDIVWGYEYAGGTRTVDTHIQKLRAKLGLADYIKTVHKVGYRFEADDSV